MTAETDIDVVFTWVDGDRLPELDWWRVRLRNGDDSGDVAPWRWRDNGELRYSLRALTANMPWVRRVFLVTNGQVPAWLDQSAARLEVVTHEEIFPDPSVLPTFNSAAISAVLHRIPGLAEHYVYLNDDIFVGRPLVPTDFLTPEGGTVVYVEKWSPPNRLDAGAVVDRQLAFNRLLLGPGRWRMPAHAPQLFRRGGVKQAWARWTPYFERTVTHRFRSTDDVLVHLLYLNTLLAEGPPHRAVADNGNTVMLRAGWQPDLLPALEAVTAAKPLSFCINDEVNETVSGPSLWNEIRALLARRFPTPSPFEIGPEEC
jgi:hypothetical protein